MPSSLPKYRREANPLSILSHSRHAWLAERSANWAIFSHRLINETTEDVVYLEVGDRTPGDEGSYPDDDLKATLVGGKWKFVHRDGTPYA